jgi:hypothetical protein
MIKFSVSLLILVAALAEEAKLSEKQIIVNIPEV